MNMNVNMDYQSDGNKLEVKLTRDFNYNAVINFRKIYNGEKNIVINLRRAKFVDSEAIIYIHKLMESGCEITLLEVPGVLIECLRILSLEQVWKQKIKMSKRG